MADTDRNITPLPAPNPFYRGRSFQGNTFTELEQVVEHAILRTSPPMTLAQIRILLHVWDACETCSGEGFISVRGYNSEFVEQERCQECKGKGYTEPVLDGDREAEEMEIQ